MGKVLLGIFATIASLMLADALMCNKCSYGLLGFCLSNTEETCATNTSVCSTGKITFPAISSNFGFNTQGCREPAGCNMTSNGTLLLTYMKEISCCSTDLCNPVTISGAPSTRMTFTAAVGAAVLASVLGSVV